MRKKTEIMKRKGVGVDAEERRKKQKIILDEGTVGKGIKKIY